MIYSISYDLQNATSEYQDLYDGIKGFGTWWHQTESVWMIKTEKSAKEVRDYLMKFLDVPGKIEANGQSNLDIDLYSELLNKGQVNVTELADKYHVDAKKIKDVAKLIITFVEEKVIKIECTYETESGKQAVLTTNYEY